LNWKGETLLDIPPYEDIVGILTLTDRESQILQERAEDAKAKCVQFSNSFGGDILMNIFAV
jgi:hypothetical protein